jgi:transcriptional regulator with XRE-family HTH domain
MRFVYDLLTTHQFLPALAAEGVPLVPFCQAFELTPADLSAWSRRGYIPHWARLAALLFGRDDFHRARPASLERSLTAWKMSEASLARLLGMSPGTIRNWQNGSNPMPLYIPLLLGALHLPGALIAARMLAAETIRLDKSRPDLPEYPFRRADRSPQTKSAPPEERAVAE